MPEKRTIPRTCLNCGKDFFVSRRRPSEPNAGRFCSLSCSSQYNRWQGGRYVDKSGYVHLWQRGTRKLRREHRVVMEAVLGRPLDDTEHVHHRNHDTSDNRPENLEILTPTAHARLHNSERVYKTGWSKTHDCCIECGTTEREHRARGLCERCYFRQWRAERGSVHHRNT